MIQDQTTKVIYVGNGQTTHFPFKFKYNDKAHIHVAIYDIDTQVQTELTKDFFVDSEKNEVIYPGYQSGQEPPEAQIPPVLQANQKLVIYRQTPLTQEIDFGSKYPLPFVENGTDKNTMISQEMKEALERSVKVDMGSEVKPDELLTDIKQNVADANQSAQNAQQSADEAQEYAQNANANAQSINIRTFPNVESMKQANNLKTGGLIKTQGFYQSGDGGGADYVIVNDIGEDEVDEASIIALQKGLYAKLLITDYINIKWFGAYVDGEHDDSTAFNNCVEFLQRTKKEIEQIQALAVKTKVVIPHGVMKISDTIKVDINVMSLDGGGSVILADGLEDNSYAIWVNNWTAKNGYATYANIISQVGNFILTGTNRFDPVNGFLMGTKEAQEGSAVIGYGGARVRMERIMVQNLYTSITWGSNQYLDSWHNISVNHCHVGLDNLSSPFNTGENINFHNSVFFGNDKMYNTSLTMLFNNCSFDYNTQWFNPPVLRAWLTDCHIEGWFFNGTENSKNPFVTTTGGRWCRFKMVGGDIGPVNTVHSGDVALFNVGTTAHQGVVLDNVYMDKLSSTYLINGTGVYRVNLCDYHDTNPDKVAPVCNLLGIDSFSGLTAIPKEITAGATEQISIVGDNLRVTTQSPAYGRSSIFVTVPTKDHSYIKLFLKAKLTVSSITTEKIWLSIETGYLDKDNNWIKKRGHQLNVQLDNVVANEWVTGTIGHPINMGKEEPYIRFEITFYNMYIKPAQVDVAELQVSGY